MLALQVSCTPASADEVEAALARLDTAAGAYFGCDGGVAGLHPHQALLLTDAALAFTVHADGVTAVALSQRGRALLDHPALAPCRDRLGRGSGRQPLAALRAFLASFPPLPEAVLLGGLRFDAWQLAADQASSTQAPLGHLLFGLSHLRRGDDGRWQRVDLAWPGMPADDAPLPQPAAAAHATPEPVDDFAEGGYAEVVARALTHLRERPLVSLTLSQSFRRRLPPGSPPPAAVFAGLRQANPAPATFFLHTAGERLFGASPDLQLVVADRQVATLPVCGTVARGAGPVAEAEALRELLGEAVDAASLTVCSDALRNDLAPLCEPGTLRLTDRRRPLALATVVHTVDRLAGRLRTGVDAWDAIVATAAPPMVTGAPRAEALRSIAALEASPRGWYGGLVVAVAADGSAMAGTILRTAVLRGDVVEVRAGGDLLADSDPPREERESRHKAVSLWRAFGLERGPTATASQRDAGMPPMAVALHQAGDPFPDALADLLAGLARLDADAPVRVLGGSDATACARWLAHHGRTHLLAVGDAAACVLHAAGADLHAIAPEQGRLLVCDSTADAPWPATRLHAGRYARLHADPARLQGWQVWARDAQGRPVALAQPAERTVCLLWRPDSVLCDAAAQAALVAALAWAAG